MNWTDEAIVLSVRPHGETAAVVELLTRNHGRHLGLVHGGRSRRLRPTLQTGNHVDVTWKSRLVEQLGHYAIELRRGFAAEAMGMADPARLAALSTLAMLARLLPERDPHPALYEVSLFVLGFFDDASVWPALMVRWSWRCCRSLVSASTSANAPRPAPTTSSSTSRRRAAGPSRPRQANPTKIVS